MQGTGPHKKQENSQIVEPEHYLPKSRIPKKSFEDLTPGVYRLKYLDGSTVFMCINSRARAKLKTFYKSLSQPPTPQNLATITEITLERKVKKEKKEKEKKEEVKLDSDSDEEFPSRGAKAPRYMQFRTGAKRGFDEMSGKGILDFLKSLGDKSTYEKLGESFKSLGDKSTYEKLGEQVADPFVQSYNATKKLVGGWEPGSWGPPWYDPSILPGWRIPTGGNVFQKYAQDGDSGFFYNCDGGLALGGHMPLNSFTESTGESYTEPEVSTVIPTLVPEEVEVPEDAEPEQHSNYTPPFSQIEENNSLYEKPFEFPPYKGGFHKKR